MTSNSSSIKQNDRQNKNGRKLFWHSCRSYWWLAVICSVVYGFAGPVYTLLKLYSITTPSQANYQAAVTEERLLARYLEEMARWLQVDGFLPLYLAAVVLAAVIGCVMFFYLQQKRQVNFYHSQPISRSRLFWNQYLTGLFLNVLPLLVMVALSCLLIVAYRLGAVLSLTAVLVHVGQLLLLTLASYSIAVLSSQLAGTMLTQMALNAVLHFCVPVAAFLVNGLFDMFFATYNGSSEILTAALKFSPLCAVFAYADAVPRLYGSTAMQAMPMAGGMLATLLMMGAILTALSWLLYQKRPSEATGKAMVYSRSEPVLKAYLMFVGSIAAGMIFSLAGSRLFFYFAVVAFAVLIHMTCEVILQHDFKAMGRKLPQCAVILVLILAVVSVFRFDWLGYDQFLPEPAQVEQVALEVDGIEPAGNWLQQSSYSQDEAVRQAVYDLLQPVVQERQYRASQFERMQYEEPVYEKNGTVKVCYVLTNGRTVERSYRSVPYSAIAAAYEALYDQQAYREALYSHILAIGPEQLNVMSVDDYLLFARAEEDQEMLGGERSGRIIEASTQQASGTDGENPEGYEQAKEILAAYQKDLRDRQFSALTQPEEYRMSLDWIEWYKDFTVYASDKRTMALLEELELGAEEAVEDFTYDEALIFRCQPSSEQELRTMTDQLLNGKKDVAQAESAEDYIQQLQGKAQLTGHLTGAAAVQQFAQETGILHLSGAFAAYDDSHIVLMRYAQSARWTSQLLYRDTLPAQYQ